MHGRCLLGTLTLTLVGGCSDGPRVETPFNADGSGTTDPTPETTTQAATTRASTTGTDTSTTVSADGSTNASTTDEIKLDVAPPDIPEAKPQFCNSVDILFVIDNSLSMNQHQTQLALAWPTFVDEMWENLPVGTDLHVGMTTTSFYDGNCSEFVFNCETNASSNDILNRYIPPQDGNTGVNGEQGRLFEWDGQRYFSAMVGDDSGDLKTWFSQAAVAAGEDGCSFEMMSAAAGYPFHPANAEYNEGFLRDEGSVLVIIVLTDEPDKSPEGADAYYDMILDAKAGCGGDSCVVITGIVDPCIEGVNNELWQFFNQFSNFVAPVGDIDEATDYANVVGTALAEIIGETCDEIQPEG